MIKHLNEYIQSEGYLERKANYEEIYGNEENDFSVTRVIDISANIPPTNLPIHLLAVKAKIAGGWSKPVMSMTAFFS